MNTISTNVIFNKDKNNEKGFVYVNFSRKKTTPIRKSTEIKITRDQFDAFYVSGTNRFRKNKSFDYKTLNDKIAELEQLNPFDKIIEEENDFIVFFENELENIFSGGTKTTYNTALNNFKLFKTNLKFEEINTNLLVEYKNFLLKKGLSPGYIRNQLIIINIFIEKANDIRNTEIFINKKKIVLKKNSKRKDLLSDQDIKKLMNYNKDLYSDDITFGLFQYFSHGLRFIDTLLIRNNDFKDKHIEIFLPKTNTHLKVDYSSNLIMVLYKYLFKESYFSNTEMENLINLNIANTDFANELYLKEIFSKIKKRKKNDFFFDVPESLKSYDKNNFITQDQFKTIGNIRGNYNRKLAAFAKKEELSVSSLSSHSFRYKYVSDCLDVKIPYYEISKSLGHTSIDTTEKYIIRNFTTQDNSSISNEIDAKYLGKRKEIE